MMSKRFTLALQRTVLVGAALCVAAPLALAQTKPDNPKATGKARATQAITAEQQKENASDRATTRKIRRALMGDKSLSAYAHNVKVVTMNGEVTLKGPVQSDVEKQAVEMRAKEVAGPEHVKNELTIAPKGSTK